MRSMISRLLILVWTTGLLLAGLPQAQAQLTVTTVAGGAVKDGGPATAAPLTLPRFAAYDKAGNLYIADDWAHRIRKVNQSGVISTIAGNGISGFSGDGGPAKSALVSFPTGITIDGQGNILFTDQGNYRVRRIDPQGIITTIAGTGVIGYTGDGGPAINATFNSMYGLAVDRLGNIYICDEGNNVIRKVDLTGTITTVAGNGTAGFSGDGGPAISASLDFPYAVLPDASGNFYISDYLNDRVRKVNTKQIIKTVVGNGSSGCTGDGGPATSAAIGGPRGLLLSGGNLLVAGGGCSKIRTVALSTQIINSVAGSTTGYDGDGNPPLSTRFYGESALLLDKSGNLVIVDRGNDRVRVLTTATQLVTSIVGGYTGDGGKGTASALDFPQGINFDHSGNLYIADDYAHRIRKVTPGGIISTFAGSGISGYTGDGGPATSATLNFPEAMAADSRGNVYISDQFGIVLRKVNGSGIISTSPASGFFGLFGLATDASGNVYGADAFACVVWKISPNGTVTTFAGDSVTFQCGYNGDNIPAAQALLNGPNAVALDSAGNVYIADEFNNRIRVVSASNGNITTLAGNGTCGFSGDGGPANLAMICDASGVATDTSGNVFIADLGNGRVRSVNSSQIIQTIAGTGSFAGYNGNGLPALQTNLDAVYEIAVNPAGVVYWSDYVQYRVRKAQ
jgi:trimeric autotransporter adhesin